jgi:hypothetical protein
MFKNVLIQNKKYILAFLLLITLITAFFVFDAKAQDVAANTPVDIPVSLNYQVFDPVFGMAGTSQWNSTQFDYVGVTTGQPFLSSGFFFFVNETRTSLGELKFASAGAIRLPTPVVDSVLYTIHLVTKDVLGDYTISHSFEINENATATRIRTGRIVNGTPVETEEQPEGFTLVTIYPNPTREGHMATLKFNSNVAGRVNIVVTDVLGRTANRVNTNINRGTNEIAVGSNSKGVNLVQVFMGDQILTTSKFIVK